MSEQNEIKRMEQFMNPIEMVANYEDTIETVLKPSYDALSEEDKVSFKESVDIQVVELLVSYEKLFGVKYVVPVEVVEEPKHSNLSMHDLYRMAEL
jgi:hypothetical protein